MRHHAFVFQSILFVALRDGDNNFLCHALLPSSNVVKASILSSRRFQHDLNDRQIVRNSSNGGDLNDLNDDAWDEEASEAILSGQGDLFSLRSVRGGDNDASHSNTNKLFSTISPSKVMQSIKEGYNQRIAADPSFLYKSILEIILAASTQYMAEVSRRGKHRIVPEIDFVFAGVLTAVCGKYYSMWRVARTVNANASNASENESSVEGDASSTPNWRDRVPTNAFQPTLLDGSTKPTLSSRCMAFVLPMPQLFRAGVIASTIGYGLTSLLVQMRTMMIPQYIVATKPVSVPLAAIYTGVFMAFVSNIRYQLLQGIVEPIFIDGIFFKIQALGNSRKMKYLRYLKRLVIVLVRWANGLLGSLIAIAGMRALGLQQLKE